MTDPHQPDTPDQQQRPWESEERFRALIMHSSDVTSVLTPDGTVIYQSPSLKRVLGYDPEQLAGVNTFDFVHPADRERSLQIWQRAIEQPDLITSAEYRFRRADGTWAYLETIVSNHLANPVIRGMVLNTRDITERKHADAQIARNLRETRVRLDVSEALAGAETEDDVLDVLIEHAGLYPQTFVSITTFDGPRHQPYGTVRRTTPNEDGITSMVPVGIRFQMSTFPKFFRFFTSNRPVISNDIETDPDIDEAFRASTRQRGLHSFAAIPLLAENEPYGYIAVLAHSTEFFGEEQLHLYQTLADQGAVALRAAYLRAAVRESQQRLSLLVQQSPLAVIEFSLDFRIVAWNPAAERIFGYRAKEALGCSAAELIIPATAQAIVGDTWKALLALEGGNHSINDNRTKDGRLITCEWYNAPLVGADGQLIGVASIAQDVTERRRVEAELRTSETRYRALVESQIDLISRYLPDTTLTFVNDAYCQFYGRKHEDLIGQSYLTMVAPEFHAQALKETQHFLEDPTPIGGEYLNYRWDGTECWIHWILQGIVDEHGRTVEIQATGRDVTPLKRAEEELRKFRYSIDQASIGVFWVGREGQFLYVNDHACRSLGYTSAELLQMKLWDIDPIYPREQFELAWTTDDAQPQETSQQTASTPSDGGVIETIHQRKDGTRFPVEVSGASLRVGGQNLLVAFSRDISERKRTENELHRLNVELEQRVTERTTQLADANKELEAFAYSVSHDLRAPLRAIDGYTRILVEDHTSALDTEGQRICGVIRNETRRMGQLIDDLLALSRVGRVELRTIPIDMEAMARAVFTELCPADDRARIEMRIAPLPAAVGDETLIRQVWINLLSNAIKFSAKREHASIAIAGSEQDGETIYTVEDNGAGFDMRYADKLFGAFQRLHSEREFSGTGVGLAIVQRIIQRHGGRVWAEAIVDQGATVSFALPRSRAVVSSGR